MQFRVHFVIEIAYPIVGPRTLGGRLVREVVIVSDTKFIQIFEGRFFKQAKDRSERAMRASIVSYQACCLRSERRSPSHEPMMRFVALLW